jgi:hypothetical protein
MSDVYWVWRSVARWVRSVLPSALNLLHKHHY